MDMYDQTVFYQAYQVVNLLAKWNLSKRLQIVKNAVSFGRLIKTFLQISKIEQWIIQ